MWSRFGDAYLDNLAATMLASSPPPPERLKSISALLLDVDGVLTDGTIWYDDAGNESKGFNVKDGLITHALVRMKYPVGFITGRTSPVVERRATENGIPFIRQGVLRKDEAFQVFVGEFGLSPEQVAYIGDDLNDWPAMQLAGLKVCPADASADIRQRADWVLATRGGHGAVREFGEAWLRARGDWEQVMAHFNC